ncbi:hypothetical protein ACOACO_10550 [Nocardioides sp. CPCC 205120]|uniref:hypothetical protein n=1 Tax=Nocardioides sp. CPCC 205120 TaxID=3406462 RepID=UPI003B50929C
MVDVDLDPYAVDEPGEYVTPEYELLEHARLHTPLPGSGLAPIDYPPTVPIVDVEREAGRLPHTRLAGPGDRTT